MLPLGVVTTPLVGHVVHQGPWFSLMATNVAGCIHTLASIFNPIVLQPLTFALFGKRDSHYLCISCLRFKNSASMSIVIYRTLLYSSLVAAITSLFGFDKMGSLLGVLFSLASAFALLQYPIAWWTVRYQGGDWRPGFAVVGVLQLPLFLLTLNACKKTEVEAEAPPAIDLAQLPSSSSETSSQISNDIPTQTYSEASNVDGVRI